MQSITGVQQQMLDRMEQIKILSTGAGIEGAAIKPAQLFEAQPAEGFAKALANIVHTVDNQQQQASALTTAVGSGKSDDLVGAMIESQKASVSFSALLQVRNKLTGAFEEIMRTQM
jgi:flagellar hook-basal body complex protein FliE